MAGWVFGAAVFIIGVLNLVLVHAVPGIIYLLLSLVYFPQSSVMLRERLGMPMPVAIKIILGIVIVWFTLGISDLGDMID